MIELINRKALLDEYDRQHKGAPGGARKLIEEAPAVDAVEVVRCKDCDNLYFKDDYYCCSNHRGLTVIKPDTYCPYGERDI